MSMSCYDLGPAAAKCLAADMHASAIGDLSVDGERHSH